MKKATDRKRGWTVVVSDGHLLRITPSLMGPTSVSMRLAHERSPNNLPLQLVDCEPAGTFENAMQFVKQFRTLLAPYHQVDAPRKRVAPNYRILNLPTDHYRPTPIDKWFRDCPEVREILARGAAITPEPEEPSLSDKAAEPKAVTGPEAVEELERSVRRLARTVSAPRRRIPVRDANGDIIAVDDVIDESAVTEQQVAELNAAVRSLARAADAPRRRIPVRDDKGDIIEVRDVIDDGGA